MSKNKYSTVSARPAKRFFVELITRDILVEDAILDLLDNCVDGIIRSQPRMKGDTPYEGYWANITVNKNIFEIEDNCGGIPWEEHDRAFRMGRPYSAPTKGKAATSVGVYGIGMKRAIFKMGVDATVWTQSKTDNYFVPISQQWMSTEDLWDLDVLPSTEKMEENGTRITIKKLHKSISDRFDSEVFIEDLLDKIENHYAMILRKGFKVSVNGIPAIPKPIEFRFARESKNETTIRPYVFKTVSDGVLVFLAVGLREAIPGVEDVQRKSEYAGWTVICNDRVILYCDKSELTGWGTAGVPQYHNQFIAISGVVEFYGDPRKLPTTTTKRGLEYSSSLYLKVLERMREGTSLFTDFTNKWKMREKEASSIVTPVPSITYPQLRVEAEKLSYNKTRVGIQGDLYKPKLPMPPEDTSDLRISYIRNKLNVLRLAEELFDTGLEHEHERDLARKVGEASFDFTYKQLVDRN
jgi:hypothetical protein